MTAVLATSPYLAFYDNDGNPLAGGLIYTYAAGTTTPKATYTDSTGTTPMSNPIVLDAAGRSTWWLIGSYKYVVKDSLGNTIRTTDNVTAFTTLAESNSAYFQSFSGTGAQTAYTTSEDLGTEEKGLMVFVDSGTPTVIANGDFATDTIWTKGAGWTIAAGVATATGTISTAISQTATAALVAGLAYNVVYTITASAGTLTASVGGQSGTARNASGTYRETIVAGSTQTIAFTGAGFTGTLDTVVISLANSKGYEILNPSAYTINGTSLTFASAPASGTNNIYVFAPSLLLGAASAAAGAAEASATAALASQVAAAGSAASAAAYAVKNKWTFSTITTMADPATANVRFNNAALASVTAIAISDFSANSGNPNIGNWIATWDDAGGTNRGSIFIFKDESNFAIYNVNSASTDNTTWFQLPVTFVTSSGSFSNLDTLYFGFAASGTTTVTGGITALTGEVTASGAGSVAATVAKNATLQTVSGQVSTKLTTEGTIASATTTDLGSVTTSNIISITGTTTITSLGSSASTANPLYFVRFTGALTLTHNATSLILPSAANIVTVAGDTAVMKYEGSGNWRCVDYTRASGAALVGGGQIKTTTTISASANVTFSSLDFANNTYEFYFNDIVNATDNTNFFMILSENNFSTSQDTVNFAYGMDSAVAANIGGEGSMLKFLESGRTLPYQKLHGAAFISQLVSGGSLVGTYGVAAQGQTNPSWMNGIIGTLTAPATYFNAVRFQMSAGNLTSGTITMVRKPIS